ncbi:MAG: signal peptide peptidase SppA [Deltaproteobacteria bacterium]|nr:signal peptide peptidase SppA [Deltaproteobacteria bacterium]
MEQTPGEQPAVEAAAVERSAAAKRPTGDRRALYGLIALCGLVFACLGLAALLVIGDRKPSDEGPQIGVVEIHGPISGAKQALRALRLFEKDDEIKAIVVRIDSPGGAIGPSQEIYGELLRLRKKKPVVASMGTVAASGGYYIASGAEKIVANGGTITGSIGVISYATNLAELLALARIKTETFKTGRFKDTGSPLRPISEADRRYLKELLDELLAQFIDDVAKGRSLARERVKQVADGRVFSGRTAKSLGLIDQLGNFNDALRLARDLAKQKGRPVPVYPAKRQSLIQRLLGDASAASQLRQLLREALTPEWRIESRLPGATR